MKMMPIEGERALSHGPVHQRFKQLEADDALSILANEDPKGKVYRQLVYRQAALAEKQEDACEMMVVEGRSSK
mgnify:CR=1 FL=1|jgi:hypothetical protein